MIRDIDKAAEKVYNKDCDKAKDLVSVGDEIAELGIPIVNKRVSVTPISIIGAATDATDYTFAKALDRAAKEVGVNFGGFSAPGSKRATKKGMKSHQFPFLELLQRQILCLLFSQYWIDQDRDQI